MSLRNCLVRTAIGTCVAASAIIGLFASAQVLAQSDAPDVGGYSEDKDQASDRRERARQSELVPVAPVIVSDEKPPVPGPYRPDCGHPKNVEDANFCQQRRSADAAERAAQAGLDAVRIADEQLSLARWGLLGVLMTVGLTFWTARSAKEAARWSAASAKAAAKSLEISDDSAKSARKAVAVTQQIGEAQVRAYLAFEIVGGEVKVGKPILFKVKITNRGQSPALCLATASNACIRPSAWDRTSEIDEGPKGPVPSMTFIPVERSKFMSIWSLPSS